MKRLPKLSKETVEDTIASTYYLSNVLHTLANIYKLPYELYNFYKCYFLSQINTVYILPNVFLVSLTQYHSLSVVEQLLFLNEVLHNYGAGQTFSNQFTLNTTYQLWQLTIIQIVPLKETPYYTKLYVHISSVQIKNEYFIISQISNLILYFSPVLSLIWLL